MELHVEQLYLAVPLSMTCILADLQVGGQMVACLVDTGSAISLINRSLLQRSSALWNLPSPGTTLSAVTANGLPIQISATIDKEASELITHKFYITDDISRYGILDMDLLKPLAANVDLREVVYTYKTWTNY